MFSWIEFALVVTSAVIACAFPNLGWRWFERAERLLNRLAQKQGLSVLVVGLAALTARAALLPILPIPQPGVQDEFGYLLLADTFAHGRLTNPTHPMWVHFESLYIIWQPTYTAMYYPAQGLIMAVGQVVAGTSLLGRLAERRRDVCGHLLDVARLAITWMGSARRVSGCDSPRDIQLLGE